ncbi:hypothetical protein FOMPIDRAFT_1050267 [Fomitopsis schrenkii]|uniref:Uncharacterized protein n=1 Tax=Fomitopsis schrenkii TaxID=2126942 RepID=S8FNR0_FOMSC|nr:hypothetical protein FOMPIDRAFT_1050267 [Fomitopsis schrenkii]
MKQNSALECPPLPTQHLNLHLKHFDPAKPPQVKFQEIIRNGESAIVARLKIQTPSVHVFVLRRFDTGAISLTTMFRAAFPTATDDHEKAESSWIPLQLADSYRLSTVLPILAKALPEPGVVYRRSTRAQQPTPEQSPAPAKKHMEASLPTHPVVLLCAESAVSWMPRWNGNDMRRDGRRQTARSFGNDTPRADGQGCSEHYTGAKTNGHQPVPVQAPAKRAHQSW